MKFNSKDQYNILIIETENGFQLISKDTDRKETDFHNNIIEISKNELSSLAMNMIPLVERLQGKYSTLGEAYKAFKMRGE